MLDEKSFIFFMKKTLVSNLLLTLLFSVSQNICSDMKAYLMEIGSQEEQTWIRSKGIKTFESLEKYLQLIFLMDVSFLDRLMYLIKLG